jgi:type IV secretory pathway VirB4 component
MLYLREYRAKADRLFDHLPWVALIGPGLLLNKDGGFQKTLAFRGPDLASSTDVGLGADRDQALVGPRPGLRADRRRAAYGL